MVDMQEVLAIAGLIGIEMAERFSRDDLIRTIQLEFGKDDCYNNPEYSCRNISDCIFRDDCQTRAATFKT